MTFAFEEWARGAKVAGRLGFDAAAALAQARETLSRPPARPFIERHAGVGRSVAAFVLPLGLCPTLNAFAEMPSWARKRIKNDALALMLRQHGGYRADAPLPGRPMVLAVRFSSREPDRDSAWTKVPLDRLTSKKGGLGLISDDRPSALDARAWWEPAPKNKGAVYLEVWTGR